MARPRGKSAKPPAGGIVGHLARVVFTLVLAAFLFVGLAWLGFRASDKVADAPRFRVKFADVACDPPPGKTREVFLAEVRHLGNLPETFAVVKPELADELAAAFPLHPWVEGVTSVDVAPDRVVHVTLVFRTPVLLVKVKGDPPERLVDRHGILLPPAPAPEGVATLAGVWPVPTVDAGHPWDNDIVRRAAELIREFSAHQIVTIERVGTGWRLVGRDKHAFSMSW